MTCPTTAFSVLSEITLSVGSVLKNHHLPNSSHQAVLLVPQISTTTYVHLKNPVQKSKKKGKGKRKREKKPAQEKEERERGAARAAH